MKWTLGNNAPQYSTSLKLENCFKGFQGFSSLTFVAWMGR